MEHGLQTSLKRYALSIEDKMAAVLRRVGEAAPLMYCGKVIKRH